MRTSLGICTLMFAAVAFAATEGPGNVSIKLSNLAVPQVLRLYEKLSGQVVRMDEDVAGSHATINLDIVEQPKTLACILLRIVLLKRAAIELMAEPDGSLRASMIKNRPNQAPESTAPGGKVRLENFAI